MSEERTRELLCELLRAFYGREWVSGTGGGICALTPEGHMLLAPTGVHKERIQPPDFFVIDVRDGSVIRQAADPALRPSECNSIFRAAINERDAGAVMHSHALSSVLAADLVPDADHLEIKNLEMLKGIRAVTNRDLHLVPVITNTPKEFELTDQVEAALKDERFAAAQAILVRDHGAYIWGADAWETKRHAEVYHFLFEATVARARA
ncbi:MAG: methylthioribulose 1-phosphate dehydratase [Actinomycetota bacterium]